jgi:hypothetical protein
MRPLLERPHLAIGHDIQRMIGPAQRAAPQNS